MSGDGSAAEENRGRLRIVPFLAGSNRLQRNPAPALFHSPNASTHNMAARTGFRSIAKNWYEPAAIPIYVTVGVAVAGAGWCEWRACISTEPRADPQQTSPTSSATPMSSSRATPTPSPGTASSQEPTPSCTRASSRLPSFLRMLTPRAVNQKFERTYVRDAL